MNDFVLYNGIDGICKPAWFHDNFVIKFNVTDLVEYLVISDCRLKWTTICISPQTIYVFV